MLSLLNDALPVDAFSINEPRNFEEEHWGQENQNDSSNSAVENSFILSFVVFGGCIMFHINGVVK